MPEELEPSSAHHNDLAHVASPATDASNELSQTQAAWFDPSALYEKIEEIVEGFGDLKE